MRANKTIKSAIKFKGTGTYEDSEWLYEPLLLAMSTARITEKDISLVIQHNLEKDVLAVSISDGDQEESFYDKDPKKVFNNLSAVFAKWTATYIGNKRNESKQKKKRPAGKKNSTRRRR